MKKYKLIQLSLLVFLFIPLHLSAQDDVTGLWKGQLFDDTTKEYLPYEIAISDDAGKLSGYSYTVFKGDKDDEIGVKKIWLKRKEDKIIIEDDYLVANTYAVAVSKLVRKRLDLTLMIKDSVMVMSGSWRIYWMKKYLPRTGKIEVRKKNDLWKEEPLIKKLDEMKLSGKLSFVQLEKKKEITITGNRRKKEMKEEQVDVLKDSAAIALVAKPYKKEKKNEVKNQEADEIKPVFIEKAAADVDKRRTKIIQSVYFKTDSLIFTLYDNGIVDGDTVSILMNGNLIFAKQELTEKPVSKTIYSKNISDSSMLILYAENLGSIPPNTGLLIIYDGKTRNEIFFSADLETNDAVILKRNKDGLIH